MAMALLSVSFSKRRVSAVDCRVGLNCQSSAKTGNLFHADELIHADSPRWQFLHYRHLIAESERDPKRDEDRHKTLLTLLVEEISKDKKPFD